MANTRPRWVFTVFGDRPRRIAVSSRVAPDDTESATLASAGVSPYASMIHAAGIALPRDGSMMNSKAAASGMCKSAKRPMSRLRTGDAMIISN